MCTLCISYLGPSWRNLAFRLQRLFFCCCNKPFSLSLSLSIDELLFTHFFPDIHVLKIVSLYFLFKFIRMESLCIGLECSCIVMDLYYNCLTTCRTFNSGNATYQCDVLMLQNIRLCKKDIAPTPLRIILWPF